GRRLDLGRLATEADLLCEGRAPLRVGRRRQHMLRRQFPAGAVLRGFKSMSNAEMPAEHLAAKPAFKANNIVALHRSPDRDSRDQRRRCWFALAEATECAMHCRNQAGDLIDSDTMLRDITTDNPRNQDELNLLRGPVLGHVFHISKKNHLGSM